MKTNDKYLDMYGHKITITGVLDQCIYYESKTKNFGLIDSKDRYFLQNSIYHINLQKITL